MDDGANPLIPDPTPDAFEGGALNFQWISMLVKLVKRQILIKTGPGLPDAKALQSAENIVLDLTAITLGGLRMTAVTNGAATELIFNAMVAPPLP